MRTNDRITRIVLRPDSGFSFSECMAGVKLLAYVSPFGYARVYESELVHKGKGINPYTRPDQLWCLAPDDYKEVVRC